MRGRAIAGLLSEGVHQCSWCGAERVEAEGRCTADGAGTESACVRGVFIDSYLCIYIICVGKQCRGAPGPWHLLLSPDAGGVSGDRSEGSFGEILRQALE